MKINGKALNNKEIELLEFILKVAYVAADRHKRKTADDLLTLDIVDFIKKFKIPVDVLSES
ncbi:MAG: hypothetical protein SCJ94_11900 [Bacillota bacterium]|nr:hypothetical protein [Bacillota bacterium]